MTYGLFEINPKRNRIL